MTDSPVAYTPGEPERRAAFLGVILVALLTLLALLFHLPGRVSPDSLSQLAQARAQVFSDAHPPVMALVWRPLDALSPGPIGMVALNIAATCLGYALIARALTGPGTARFVAAFAALLFFPTTFFLLGVAWKDLAQHAAFVLATGLVMTTEGRRRRTQILCLAAAALVAWYGIGVRHNAIFAFFPLAVWAVWRETSATGRLWVRGATAVGAGAALVIALFLSHGVLGSFLRVEKAHFWQNLAAYDLVGISVHTDQDLVPDELYPGATLAKMERHYLPYSMLGITMESGFYQNTTDPDRLKRLRSAWIGAIARHPTAYARHRTGMLMACLGLTSFPWVPVYPEGAAAPEVGPLTDPRAGSVALMKQVDEKAPHSAGYRPWVHLAYVLAAALVVIVAAPRFALLALVAAAAALANTVSLWLLSPSPDFRYSLAVLFCSSLLTVVLGVDLADRLRPGARRLRERMPKLRVVLARPEPAGQPAEGAHQRGSDGSCVEG